MNTKIGRPKLSMKVLKARAKEYGKQSLVMHSAEYYRALRARNRLKEEGGRK